MHGQQCHLLYRSTSRNGPAQAFLKLQELLVAHLTIRPADKTHRKASKGGEERGKRQRLHIRNVTAEDEAHRGHRRASLSLGDE